MTMMVTMTMLAKSWVSVGEDDDDDDDDDDGDDDNVGKKFGECGGGVIHYIQGAPLAHPPPTYHHIV